MECIQTNDQPSQRDEILIMEYYLVIVFYD